MNMERGELFLTFQICFLVAALFDYLMTWLGITFLGGYEIHGNYSFINAAIFWTFINIVFYYLPTQRWWQLPRVAFLMWAWVPGVRNFILIYLRVTV